MKCRKCFSELEKPGDYCQVCGQKNTEVLGIYLGRKIFLFSFFGEKLEGFEVIKALKEEKDLKKQEVVKRNNFELVSEAVHRKRPNEIIVSGTSSREISSFWEAEISFTDEFESPDLFRQALEEYLKESEIEETGLKPSKKIGGTHSTFIGDRKGRKAINTIAKNNFVKKIVPGPIEASGTKGGGGFRFNVQRPDLRGNLRVLFKDGATVQEIRVITTAQDKESEKKVLKRLKKELGRRS